MTPDTTQLQSRLPSPGLRSGWPHPGSDLRRIRREVLALALLVIVLAIGVVVQSSLGDRRHRLDAAGAHAMDVARAVEQHVARLIDSNGQYLYDLRSHVEAEGGVDAIAPERLRFLLRSPRLHDEATRRVFLADAGGARTALAGSQGIPPSVAGQGYFARHRDDPARGIAIDAPFPADGRGGDWVLPISVRLDRPDHGFDGVAVLSFDLEYLARYFRSRPLEEDGSVALLADDGRFILRHPAFADDARAHSVGRVPAYPGTQGLLEAASPVDGTARLVAYHKVADYPLFAVVAVSRDAVLGEWMRSSLLRAILGGAVIGIVALFTVLLLARLDAERLAQARVARFERALDQAGDLLYWIAQDGRILYLNAAAARRFSPDAARAPERLTLHDILAEHAPASWERFWTRLVASGTLRFDAEHLAHDGEAYPVEVAASYQVVDGEGYALLIVRERAAR